MTGDTLDQIRVVKALSRKVRILVLSLAFAFVAEAGWYPVREGTVSLNGEWDFVLTEAEPGNAAETEIGRGKIQVPGCWELQGYLRPRYKRHFSKDYAGTYRRTFAYRDEWKGRHVILRFDGVYFGFELKVNGHDFGRTGHAPNLHQFDVTGALHEGENELEVKVLTSQIRDWLFDVNDCWTLAGITRDVSLFTVGKSWIEDVRVKCEGCEKCERCERCEKCEGCERCEKCERCEVEVKIGGEKRCEVEQRNVSVRLLDAEGRTVFAEEKETSAILHSSFFILHFSTPRLWSAEDPYLYTLEVRYADQVVREKIGIRTVKVDGFDLKVNGKPVFLKGACLNEIDYKKGRTFDREDFRRRLVMMKDAGMNFIRTAHYPFAPVFYELCDEMGFYVCDEIPISAQGSAHAGYLDDERFLPDMLERAEDTIRRDKNRPSVILWSVGNENAPYPVLRKVFAKVKACDPTRPAFFPMQGRHMLKFADNPWPEVDLYSGHYLKMDELDELLPKLTKPLLMTEYSHSNGEGFGNFEKTFRRQVAEPKMIGGSVWCFHDQCVGTDGADARESKMAKRSVPAEYQGCWMDDGTFLDSHGIFSSDGIVYGNLFPKEAYWLVKRMFRAKVEGGRLKVEGAGNPSFASSGLQAFKPSDISLNLRCDQPMLAFGTKPTEAKFVLRVGRPRTLLIRAQELAIDPKEKDFCWEPYLIEAKQTGFRTLPNGGGEYDLGFSSTNGVIRGRARFERDHDGFRVDYEFTPSPECRGKFLEAGFGFRLPSGFAAVEWRGLGPFPAVPGKSLMDDPGVWRLHRADYRFRGNRMETSRAVTSDGELALAIEAEGEPMMCGFDAYGGGTCLTHNAIAVNYGTKLDWTPVLEAPRAADTVIRGRFRVALAAPFFPGEIKPEIPFRGTYGR